MCTCGIDMATQQDTPAMHRRTCSAAGDKPTAARASEAAAAAIAGSSATTRRLNASASGAMAPRQAMPITI